MGEGGSEWERECIIEEVSDWGSESGREIWVGSGEARRGHRGRK